VAAPVNLCRCRGGYGRLGPAHRQSVSAAVADSCVDDPCVCGVASATLSSLKFHDQLRWYALRPYYVAQVAASPITPDGIHGIWWDGGSDWDVRLEYHETETDAHAWQQKQQGWLGSCKRSLNEIEPHYFLNSV
jgi:hypothetical protein